MHAVVFHVDVKQNWEGDADAELDFLVGMLRSTPGFVRGTWVGNGKEAMSLLLFETEEVARGVADSAAMPPEASVSLRRVDVYEVHRDTGG